MRRILSILFIAIFIASCSKEEDSSSSNPYNDPSNQPPSDTSIPFGLDTSSFQFLYYSIFKPTCANSGCHDGNFQPDFRTVYSSYNTLVNHTVIQNDDQQSFMYRVEPNNLKKSLLHERLNRFMKNTSGVMPLEYDKDGSWSVDSAMFKDLIDDWIMRGAPDSYGNIPGESNAKPQVVGIVAFNVGTTTNPLTRKVGALSPISIPPNGLVDVYFSFTDDKSDVSNFKTMELKSSYELFDFSQGTNHPFSTGSSVSGSDFWGNTVSFNHKATLDFSADTIGTYIYLRTYLQDEDQTDTTEIPNSGTGDIMRSYFTLKVDSL